MSNVLVVTYSYTGTSRHLAQLLASLQHWTLGTVDDVDPRRGARGMFRCMLDSLLRRRPPIRYAGPDPRGFDAVVLVSPIWAHRLAGPMRSFVAAHRASLGDVVVISVMDKSGAANAVAEVARLIGHAPLMDVAFRKLDVEDGTAAARLQAVGKSIRDAGRQTSRPPSDPPAATWSPKAA